MSKGLIYKKISKKRIEQLNSDNFPEDTFLKAFKSGEFNHARCEDFRLTSWDTENIHVKNFVWKRGSVRGEFSNCIFSDGEISEVDFSDSDFKNVTFRNISFNEGEINSFYSNNFIFELDNVIFENCIFNRFSIGQAVNSNIYLNNCRVMDSGFYLKSSCITFYRCSTENTNKDKEDVIRLRMVKPAVPEPIKIKECLFFGVRLSGDFVDILNISAKGVYLNFRFRMRVRHLTIYCEHFDLDTKLYLERGIDEIKERSASGLPPIREFDNIEIICSKGGVFGIIGFKINNLKICMIEERPKAGSAIFYSQINNLEMVGVKTNILRVDKTTINKANFRSCYFHQLKFLSCIIPDLTLNSVKIANKAILNKTKIGHITLDRVSIDKQAAWETELSAVGVLDKPEAKQKDIKNVSGQRLLTYFDRADVPALK